MGWPHNICCWRRAGAATAATGGAGASFWAVAGVSAAGGAATAANNSIVAQTGANFSGFNKVNWGQVGVNSLIGGVSGFAGGAAGYAASNASFAVNGISSPVLRSAVVSPLAAGAGHVAGGTTANLFAGQSLDDAFANSFDGIGKSMLVGGAIGVASTVGVSYANGISPWTGKSLNTSNISDNRINNYTYDERVRMRALEDPKSHNFPYSFDESILSTTPIVKPDNYMIYRLDGTMNGINGYYEIGVTKGGIINHRFFRPTK